MVFSSLVFIFVFLPAVLALYFTTYMLTRHREWRSTALNSVLLVSSLVFYVSGELKFVWVMLLTGTVDYVLARLIEKERREAPTPHSRFREKVWLVTSIIANMGLLFYFKYTGFAVDSFYSLTETLGMATPGTRVFFETVLPIGISFYTFESMSYIIDVYRKETPATKSLVNYWTFITFFPHLIAGPIIRYVELRRQLEGRIHSWENGLLGFRRFAIGLAKKVIIANPVGYYADYLFALDPTQVDTVTAWLAALTYTLQIYFDFSGYSDMAIGLGKIFGIDLPLNFNYPYISKTVQEFWRRWHITLSRWFRDYLYIPLGGNRHGSRKEYRNLFLVFALCGLWHGADLTFLLWGVFHGFFLVAERFTRKRTAYRPPAAIQHLYTLLVVIFAWVAFRSESVGQTFQLWSAMLGQAPAFVSRDAMNLLSLPHFYFYMILGIVSAVPVSAYWGEERVQRWVRLPALRYDFCFLILMTVAAAFLCGQEYNPFIYFRF